MLLFSFSYPKENGMMSMVKYQVPGLNIPRVEIDQILIFDCPYGKGKSSYLGVKTMEKVSKMFWTCLSNVYIGGHSRKSLYRGP